MDEQRVPSRHMFIGGAGIIALGLFMIVRGILHIISGEPIEDAWSEPTTGPESFFFGFVAIGLGVFAIRLGLRGDSSS